MDTCPITGEPLLNPGQTVARSALQNLRTQTNNITGLMDCLAQRIAGAGRPEHAVASRPIADSKPPISLGLLDLVDEHRDTIAAWAFHIMQHVNPAWRMPRANDWAIVQAIYQQYLPTLTQWEYAPIMVDEVSDALTQLGRIENPAPTPINLNPDDLTSRAFTYDTAAQILRLHWGRTLNRNTVHSWVHRGKLDPTSTRPPRYLLADLLRLTDEG